MTKGIGDFVGLDRTKPRSYRVADALVGAPIVALGGYAAYRHKHKLLGYSLGAVAAAAFVWNLVHLLRRDSGVAVTIHEAVIEA